jgi:hypothetical protein
MRRAAALSIKLETRGDAASKKKRKLLAEMVQRSGTDNERL